MRKDAKWSDRKEVPDPTKHQLFEDNPPSQTSIRDYIHQYIQRDLSTIAAAQGYGTLEEEDDFDEEDPDLHPLFTSYQIDAMTTEEVAALLDGDPEFEVLLARKKEELRDAQRATGLDSGPDSGPGAVHPGSGDIQPPVSDAAPAGERADN